MSQIGKSRVIASFTIICVGELASKLLDDGDYDWRDHPLGDENFPIQPHEPETRIIDIVQFDGDLYSDEVPELLAKHGLEPPTYEDAMVFGVQHPDEQRDRSIFFPHDPVSTSDGDFVIALDADGDHREIFTYWADRDWEPDYDVVAGVRKIT